VLFALAILGVALVPTETVDVHAQAPAPGSPAGSAAAHGTVFTRYCVSCHTQGMKDRGTVPIALDRLKTTDIAADPAAWEKVVLKMRAGVMPPAGSPRPDKATSEALVSFLERELDTLAAARPNPGRTEALHRLNRTEYRNAVRDLLDLEIDVSALLPADDASYGFDNIAGVLRMSPTLLERYLAAAQKVSRLAVGTPPAVPNIDYFRVIDDLSQDVQLPDMPPGTRGGTKIRYVFPMDAEYEIRVRLSRDLNEGVPVWTETQQLEILIDDERVGGFSLPAAGTGPGSDVPNRGGRGRGGAAPPAPQSTAPPAPQSTAPPAQQPPAASPGSASPPASSGPASPGPAASGPAASGETQAPQRPAISQVATGPRVTAAEREFRNKADESWNLRIKVPAGVRDVRATFLNRTAALEETTRLPFMRPYPAGVNIPETRQGAHIRHVEIVGPLNPTGPGNSPSRQRIFVCQPAAPPGDEACVRRILSTLARRAYRRPVTAADVEPLLAFYREGRGQSDVDLGMERALRRLLVSPEFLLRVERDPAGIKAGSAYRLGDLELASRLSFFLWSSIPDDELLAKAEKGQLRTPAVLEAEVRRMLADPRSDVFMENFAGQWLFLRNLQASVPVQSIFPDFDDALRQSFRRETELFFESIVRENRSALDLLRADYTFLNERLARHYGMPGIKGTHFRRVMLPAGSARAGILGHGSVLTVTSYPDRTSPVVRGKWILENLLGTPPPPPVPNVPPLKPTSTDGKVLSMRERMVQHRASPTCASCHALMDPLGLALENFDAVGKWRTLGEGATAIDATGNTPDGAKFDGVAGLRQALLGNERFVTTLTEKLFVYALGRGLEYYDAPAVRAIVRDAKADDYRLSSIIAGIVRSDPFRMRRAGS
jgi:mono/diheme cytochrome c family protein